MWHFKERQFRLGRRAFTAHPRWCAIAIIPALVATGLYETRTSAIQARVFSSIAKRLTYQVTPGASSRIVFPQSGPLNEARGYSRIPQFAHELVDRRFHIASQSLFSEDLERLSRWGITPPYREPLAAGLVINDQDGKVLYDARSHRRIFSTFDEIPPLVVTSLLFIENRELEDSTGETHNPVVDWGRSAKAAAFYAAKKVGLPFPVEGGSTLATQIEKYQYSDGGRTRSASDKFLQMISATIRVYREGEDTRTQRREIILDYLNSAPLSAAPSYGEVYGIGEGLYAWFGKDLQEVRAALQSGTDEQRAEAFKYLLALICATRAPSYYLKTNSAALEARIDFYVNQLEGSGAISNAFAELVHRIDLQFLPRAPLPNALPYVERKATNAIRTRLMDILDVGNLYDLDRLNLTAETTLNVKLQNAVLGVFEKMKDPAFVEAQGLKTEHLLITGDPAAVTYSFTLFERTPLGNALRVQADTLNQPFDLNEGMKLELGSTAKLRTLAHYLEIVSGLYSENQSISRNDLAKRLKEARDPITQWVLATMTEQSDIDLPALLTAALDRKYSGNPGEVFFTGGGAHVFANFERNEDGGIFTLREGLQRSINLVYIRLMRDIVRYHEARVPYDVNAVLNDFDNPVRQRMLSEIAGKESEYFLTNAYRRYRGKATDETVDEILGQRNTSAKKLAMLYLAWNANATPETLASWLQQHKPKESFDPERLYKAYDPHRLSLEDYAYLLSRHPLDVWCAGQLVQDPNISWNDLLQRSGDARKVASEWLFRTKNRKAQDVRLRIRVEEDAFARMLPYWQRFGFPFDRLVPSLATAIGSSADRPIALAELMGVILNDGMRLPATRLHRLHFAQDTPYDTEFQFNDPKPERVMDPAVARALRDVLVTVVQNGTATRLRNTFVDKNGALIPVGGKTGSGDNRFKTFSRGGGLRSAKAISRTGTFVFYIGDRYFGVLTAYVAGENTDRYSFTSALPVAVLKLLAPAIEATMDTPEASNRVQVAQSR